MEISRIAKWNHLHPQTLEKQYKENLSNFKEWEKEINPKGLVFPKNFGKWMSIDEVALSKGELYTVITNKERHGRKGALAALIKGTKSEIAYETGKAFGSLLQKQKIESVAFDRGSSKYHGRLQRFADGLREQGIQF